MTAEAIIIARLRPVLKAQIADARRALAEAEQLLGRRSVRKASARPFLTHITAAEAHYKSRLVAALRFGFDAKQLARRWMARPKPVTKATPAQKNDVLQEAQDYVGNLQPDPAALIGTVEALYGAGYLIGVKEALSLVRSAGAPLSMTEFSAKADALDWAQWTPGDQGAAAELAGLDGGAGLQTLLDSAGVTIKSIQETRLDQLASVLADGARSGDSVDAIAGKISGFLDDSSRAELIANTELNRAVTASTFDTYQQNGIEQWDLLVFNPCPECEDVEAANPHDLGDEGPPIHPGCRCAAAPVVSSSQQSQSPDEEI